MAVPFIDLKTPLLPLQEAVLADWASCLANTSFVGGPYVRKFETDFIRHTGISHFVSCANGTDALTLSLVALGLGPGHRIALPDVTFWATYEAIRHVGATAVLVDINADDLQLDFAALQQAHTDEPLHAVLLPHLYGWCSSELSAIRTWCESEQIMLIEDAAQAFGISFNNTPVLQGAEVATISFYPAKVIGGCMDGGGICTRNQELADKLRRLANHGRSSHYAYSETGFNSRMGDLQASFLSHLLNISESLLQSRVQGLQWYAELHASLADNRVRLHMPPVNCMGNGYLAVFTVQDVDIEELAAQMREHGIGVARTYPMTISAQPPVLQDMQAGTTVAPSMPQAAAFCNSVINLPLFAGITRDQVIESWQAFTAALKQAGTTP